MLYKIQIGEQSFANLKYPKIYPLVLDINGDNSYFYYLTTELHVFSKINLFVTSCDFCPVGGHSVVQNVVEASFAHWTETILRIHDGKVKNQDSLKLK